MLKPGHDVYILVNTSITYSVIRLRQGRTTGLFSPLFHSKITQQSPSQKVEESEKIYLAPPPFRMLLFPYSDSFLLINAVGAGFLIKLTVDPRHA